MPVTITNEGVTPSIPYTNDDAAGTIIHWHKVRAIRRGYRLCPYHTTIYGNDDDCASIYGSRRVRCRADATIDWWRSESD